MRTAITLLAFATLSFCSCNELATNKIGDHATQGRMNKANPTEGQMKIKIGNRTFTATLYNNATATAFKALLPVTVKMAELNGNEKYVDLSRNLPADASNPGTIQAGDLMLYGSSTLVLFYKSFSTSYRYTKLGRIDNPSELAAALGSGNVTVTLELQ